ncbi:MAG TPA: ATP-binding cassette domain-containing protein [Streptosporangiaceae bacterium]|nr:ATP-binding cassette domain-containing protein [Streptosporangiaceae bacterium]
MPARLAVRDLSKHYGGVQALRGVSLQVDAGEVLGLVGDNGAGKSTLVKTLSGAIAPSGGQILLDGEPVRFSSPAAARDAGVSIVYQDLSLADQRDVAANFFLGREILARHWLARRLGWLDTRAMAAHTRRELARLHTPIPDVHTAARDLSGGQRQALAIARAAAWTSKVLLLDEPTSALGVEQQQQVLELVRRVRDEGIAVIFISHQMPDVLAVCDRAVVLRLGSVAATLGRDQMTGENLVGYITGAKTGGTGNGTPATSASPVGGSPPGTAGQTTGTSHDDERETR